jgi:branched-subunit amino acid transport protein
MDQKAILLTIVGMAVVTYVPRLLPVWTLSSRPLPRLVAVWLRYVPAAVLAAMLFPAVAVPDPEVGSPGLSYLFLWAAFPTLLVAWKTRSLFGSVVVGMVVVAVARVVFGA